MRLSVAVRRGFRRDKGSVDLIVIGRESDQPPGVSPRFFGVMPGAKLDRGRPARNGLPKKRAGGTPAVRARFGAFGAKVDGIGLTPRG